MLACASGTLKLRPAAHVGGGLCGWGAVWVGGYVGGRHVGGGHVGEHPGTDMTIAKNITQCSRALWALEHWQKTSSSMPGPPGPWHAGCWGHSVLLWHLGKIQNLNTVLLLVSRQLDQSEGFKIFADGQVDRQTENSICWYRRPEGGWTKRTPPPYLHGH